MQAEQSAAVGSSREGKPGGAAVSDGGKVEVPLLDRFRAQAGERLSRTRGGGAGGGAGGGPRGAATDLFPPPPSKKKRRTRNEEREGERAREKRRARGPQRIGRQGDPAYRRVAGHVTRWGCLRRTGPLVSRCTPLRKSTRAHRRPNPAPRVAIDAGRLAYLRRGDRCPLAGPGSRTMGPWNRTASLAFLYGT